MTARQAATGVKTRVFRIARTLARPAWIQQPLRAFIDGIRRCRARRNRAQLFERQREQDSAQAPLDQDMPDVTIWIQAQGDTRQVVHTVRSARRAAGPSALIIAGMHSSAVGDKDRGTLLVEQDVVIFDDHPVSTPGDIPLAALKGNQLLWLKAGSELATGALAAMSKALVSSPKIDGVTPLVVSTTGLVHHGALNADGTSPASGLDWRDSRANFRQTGTTASSVCMLVRPDALADLVFEPLGGAAAWSCRKVGGGMAGILFQPDAMVVTALAVPQASAPPRPMPTEAARKSVLIVEMEVPEIDRNAGARNIYEFARTLVADGWTVKYWPLSPRARADYLRLLTELGIEVPIGDIRPSFSSWMRDNAGALSHVLLCRPEVADRYLAVIRRYPHLPLVYYGHDLHFARMAMEADIQQDQDLRKAAGRMEKLENRIWKSVDVSLYPTAEEVDVIRGSAPSVAVRPVTIFCFDTFDLRDTAPAENQVLFVAGFRHRPNVGSAVWFAKEIFPRVLQHVPDAKLAIIGSYPTPDVLALASPAIDVRGWVSDEALMTCYGASKVSVVPLRFGAGMKLKSVEALAQGTPLVTTPVGAQGLQGLDGFTTVTDDPAAFAAGVIELLELGPDDWLARSRAQTGYARSRFSRAVMLRSLLEAFELATTVNRSTTRNGGTISVRGSPIGSA